MNPLQFLRALVVLNGIVPLAILAWDAYRGQLGVNSVNYALHVTGLLALVFLFLSLLMTPIRWITGWGGWIAFRRALGLYAFFYTVLHLAIYVGFDRGLNLASTFREIALRRFLQVGIAALLLMIPLAVTSTNAMLRNMGARRWKQLHRISYLVAVLGVVHYYMLVKSDVRQPLAFGGVLAILFGARFGRHYLELRQNSLKAVRGNGPATPGRSIPIRPAGKLETASAKDSLRATTVVSGNPASAELVQTPDAVIPRKQWKGTLKVAAVFQETSDVKTFRLTASDDGVFPFAYLPGQFLNLQLAIDGKRVNRSYTIASSPTRSDACELSIKREPMGLASRFLHDHLKVGDILQVSGPSGKFVFTGREGQNVLLISGGVGITPNMSILRYLTDRAWSGTIWFLVVAKTEQDLIFESELNWLKGRFPRLNVCTTLSRCDEASSWSGEQGRITASLLTRFAPDLKQMPIFLCGPNPMMDATHELLLEMGVPETQIKTEAFGSKKGLKLPSSDASAPESTMLANASGSGVVKPDEPETKQITFARSMIQATASTETSVLEAAEASSIELPYECRSGICGQCKTRLVDGTVTMECEDALSGSEKALGWILACQARPQTHLVIDA